MSAPAVPQPSAPMVDLATGAPSPVWFRFFSALARSSGTGSGTAIQAAPILMRVGGTGVGAQRTLMFDPSGAVVHANPLDPGFLFAGISQQAGVAGSSIMVLESGPMTEATWAWTPRRPLFVGPNGTLTHIVPQAGVMQEVAVAYAATMVLVQPQTPITLN